MANMQGLEFQKNVNFVFYDIISPSGVNGVIVMLYETQSTSIDCSLHRGINCKQLQLLGKINVFSSFSSSEAVLF